MVTYFNNKSLTFNYEILLLIYVNRLILVIALKEIQQQIYNLEYEVSRD